MVEAEAVGPFVEVIFAEPVCVHPFISVIKTVYVPTPSPVAVCVVCAGDVPHEYVYPGVPPEALADAVPFVAPQDAGTTEVVTTTGGGSEMPRMVVVEHPSASVTVTVYEPCDSPVAVEVVCPVGFQL